MRHVVLAFLFSCLLAGGGVAQEADIQSTITRQLDAFEQDDFARAFTFASPNLQRYFQTPENFRRMVTQGYPMVWRPGSVRYLELRRKGGDLWQKVMITDREGRVHILDYRMLETAEGWRINGVQILEAGELNAQLQKLRQIPSFNLGSSSASSGYSSPI